jgi:Concanavalin A-like lectin/glucanases superfamily
MNVTLMTDDSTALRASTTTAPRAQGAPMKTGRPPTTGVRDDHGGGRRRWGGLGRGLAGAALVWPLLATGVVHAGAVHAAGGASPAAAAAAAAIPTQGLVARYLFNGDASDSSGRGHHGVNHGASPTSNRSGNGSSAYSFNGTDAYVEIPDHNDFSVSTTGRLSVSVWMRPGTLTFPDTEGTGYVHWLGKGAPDQHEWTFRMYSADNTEGRANRTSFYLFNLRAPAGQPNYGVGTYWQEDLQALAWYHYVAVVDKYANNGAGRITLYKNGSLVSTQEGAKVRSQWSFTDTINDQTVRINPQNGTAPVRVGTRDFASFFRGAVDNLYVYNRALSAAEVGQLYRDTTP